MLLVSACLAGINCKYNNESNEIKEVMDLVRDGRAVLVCPEQLGGLTTPRSACEIKGGSGVDVLDGKASVVTKEGKDVTKEFVKGAYETLKIAKLYDVNKAILKARSPSCGKDHIYDGTFSSKKRKGHGVTVALLIRNGIDIVDEESVTFL